MVATHARVIPQGLRAEPVFRNYRGQSVLRRENCGPRLARAVAA